MDFSAIRVLVIGDVMLDRFVEGEIERISPEAPVPIIRLSRTREMPGGAGNVACNIAALGAQATLIGLVGVDAAASGLTRAVTEAGRIEPILLTSRHRPTVCKTRFIASRQQIVRTDEESRLPLHDDEEVTILGAIDDHLPAADAVILSDYGKGTLSRRVIARAIHLAARHARPVFVDPKSDDFTRYHGATCITPNRRELAAAARREVSDEASVVEACRVLLATVRADAILATRSEKGMVLVERSGDVTGVSARAREVFDVSGAGDTVIATLAVSYAAGRSLQQAMRIANAAAGVVVSKLGTATASIDEVLHELGEATSQAGAGPASLPTLERAAALVAHWKGQGLSVGFTNGCFDILHAGHVSLLATARSHCDRLVVGLNSDASVSRLKGPGRPVNPISSRAVVLAALRHVDCVVGFEDDTPIELIRRLLPDVLVKGADYTIDRVVGADIIQQAGGRVLLAELVAGQSTTGIIGRAAHGALPPDTV